MLKTDATVEEKSLALAELADIKLDESGNCHRQCVIACWGYEEKEPFNPYADTKEGYAQAFAILLEFPEVMARFVHMNHVHGDLVLMWEDRDRHGFIDLVQPTQANILDEILRMNGKME